MYLIVIRNDFMLVHPILFKLFLDFTVNTELSVVCVCVFLYIYISTVPYVFIKHRDN
jgi:hypothetical protein